jgi:hypothetical protein
VPMSVVGVLICLPPFPCLHSVPADISTRPRPVLPFAWKNSKTRIRTAAETDWENQWLFFAFGTE